MIRANNPARPCNEAVLLTRRLLPIPAYRSARVDNATKKTETGRDYLTVNPKGYVPALELDSGEVLTEGAAITQYLADRNLDAELAPPAGTIKRARLQEQLNFLASELHKAFNPLFAPQASAEAKAAAPANVARRLDHCEAALGDGRPYLLGERYSVADPYLFVIAGWTKPTGIGLTRWPNVAAHWSRIAQRAAVQAAMHAEGLA